MDRWEKGSYLPALEKERGQLIHSLQDGLRKDRTGTEPLGPSRLEGTSTRPSSQVCVGSHSEAQKPTRVTHDFSQCLYTGNHTSRESHILIHIASDLGHAHLWN